MAEYQQQHPAPRSAALAPAQSANLADVLERVLDKGIVIVGDVKLLLADIEVLTLQIRLVITSVDKAREVGLDWWRNNPAFSSQAPRQPSTAPAKAGAAEERAAQPAGTAEAAQSAQAMERQEAALAERQAALEKLVSRLERLERSLGVESGAPPPQ